MVHFYAHQPYRHRLSGISAPFVSHIGAVRRPCGCPAPTSECPVPTSECPVPTSGLGGSIRAFRHRGGLFVV